MKKHVFKRGVIVAAVLAALILMAGCGKEKAETEPASEPASATSEKTPEAEISTEPAAVSDSGTTQAPEEPSIVFYHGDIRFSPELQASMGTSPVDIPNYSFTYYKTRDGQKKYHLLIEFKNIGTAAVYTPRFLVNLYDSDNNRLPVNVRTNYVYGIMAPGETDYVFADGELWEQGTGTLDIDLSKGLIPAIAEMNVNECDLSEHTFYEFDTDIEMTKTNRCSFFGKVTNPYDKDGIDPDLYYLLFDANDEIVGIVRGILRDLPAKQTKELSSVSLENLEIKPEQVDHFITRAGFWEYTSGD